MTVDAARTEERSGALPPLARWPVLGIAVGLGALLVAVSGRYGYFGDELYFVAAGRHLDWGYADQPPLVPLLALAMDTIAPDSLTVLRLPAVVVTMLGVLLAALIARELGGRTGAQLLTVAALVTSPFFLTGGHLLATSTFDPFSWFLISWLVVRWVRTRDDRLLLAVGVAAAVGLQVKLLLVVFPVLLLLAVLVVGPRDMLRRPLLWVGAAIAVLATVPTLLWQAAHGWPQLGMSRAVAAESVYAGGLLGFLPLAILGTGLLAGTALAIVGVVGALRAPELRFLAWTAFAVILLFWLTSGRPYYVGGVFPVLWAVGAVRLQARRDAGVTAGRWWRWIPTLPVFGVTLVALLWGNLLPITPIESHAGRPLMIGNFQLDEYGWPQYVDDVAAAHAALPASQRSATTVIGSSYWSAAAMDHYGPDRGLPEAFSPHRGYGYFGIPPETATSALVFGDPGEMAGMFAEARQVGVVDNDADINNLVQHSPIWLLTDRTASWTEIWERTQRL